MSNKEAFEQILPILLQQLESRLHLIGSVITRDATREAMSLEIRDKGDFIASIGYLIRPLPDGFIMNVGSNVPHEPYVLGGKVPSWTPIAPLIGWVQRRQLAWVDKKGKQLTVEQMAYMIRAKIRREGIPARNVFQTVIDALDTWIWEQISSIEVPL